MPALHPSAFILPPSNARPWTYWYWMHAAVTRQGITADLEAMAQLGLAGAYLMPISGPADPLFLEPPATQLSPAFWSLLHFAFEEADRLGFQLAMHACDGFAIAGGPWITPELSMQKVVWSQTEIEGGHPQEITLPQPQINEGYYKDITALAYPSPRRGTSRPQAREARLQSPAIASNHAETLPNLASPTNTEPFRSPNPCWIQYAYPEPVTVRSIHIRRAGNNLQANRLRLEVSDDGEHFRFAAQLEPPRHGWQDSDCEVTHAIEPVTARYFRFHWTPEGSEPGGEDLDSAKWLPVLKLLGIHLSEEPRIHQFEGKTGEVWRISPRTTAQQVPDELCVPLQDIVDLSAHLTPDGRLNWSPPPGRWTVLRLGHTSTGHRNETAGGGKGLECDKFNPEAVRLQFDSWFGEAIRQAGPELAARILKIFHVDSWECGSQNWSANFPDEFKTRRGYDLHPYLPAFAGIPIQSAAVSERFLADVRQTIAELVVERFFGTLKGLAHAHGMQFSAEAIAPTFTSDGLMHHREVDIPMGEFWFRSPTHDKPADIRDAVSGAHIYGKTIAQAEAFTSLRIQWDEHPAMVKALGDRNFALGINRFVFHIWAHNPWLDRQPGMTLNGVGLYFQRDQTWIKPARAWIEYLTRCQWLLQQGRPVVDIAVFIGEETPRRSVLPEQLVDTLPGLFGPEAVAREHARQANAGHPSIEQPAGVRRSANLSDPAVWTDPLRGYAYDSINADALSRASVQDGRIVLPGGASYGVLVVPGARPLSPNADTLSPELAAQLQAFIAAGATILFGTYRESSLSPLCIEPDFVTTAPNIAWTHRLTPDADIYLIANSAETAQEFEVSLRFSGRAPELWHPITGDVQPAQYHAGPNRTHIPLRLEPSESIFIVLRDGEPATPAAQNWLTPTELLSLTGPWQVTFGSRMIEFPQLQSWSHFEDEAIRHFSGTATYTQTFDYPDAPKARIYLDLGHIANLAEVTLNGQDCGVAWTAPYRVEITHALRPGTNTLQVAVTNTWANRIIADQTSEHPQTWTNAPFRLQNHPLLEAGLLGPVRVVTQKP